eukprot:5829755-Prymnesium_polylepis.1
MLPVATLLLLEYVYRVPAAPQGLSRAARARLMAATAAHLPTACQRSDASRYNPSTPPADAAIYTHAQDLV